MGPEKLTRIGARHTCRKQKEAHWWIKQVLSACEDNDRALFHDCEGADRSLPCAARDAEGTELPVVDGYTFVVDDEERSEPQH